MKKTRLMIVMDDVSWTLAALHLACAISRRNKSEMVLLKMVPVRHPLLLGTAAGYVAFNANDAQVLTEMTATAEDYGISLDVQLFQYSDYWPGVVDAAARLNVTAVIARIPPSPIPYWHDFRHWWLRRRLARQQQLFFALDDLTPSLVWTPSITLQHDLARVLEQHQS